MARKALNLNNGFNYTGVGTGTGIVESNAQKADDNFAELYAEPRYLTLVCPVVAEETNVAWGALPRGATVVDVQLSTTAAITGTVSVPVQRGDNVGSYGGLLFDAPIDPTELTSSLVSQTLTETETTLEFAAGQTVKLSTIADAGATGGPVTARIEYELSEA